MVVEVGAHPGEIGEHVDPDLTQVGLRSDAGDHQQLRRADRPGGQDDLAPGLHGDRVAAGAVLDPGAAVAAEQEAVHQRVGDQVEVGAVEDREEVGVGGALPPAVENGGTRSSRPLFETAVDVLRDRMPEFAGRIHRGHGERMGRLGIRGIEGAVLAAHGGIAALDVLGALEVGQQVVVSPALRTGRDPRVMARRDGPA